jgi:MFS family permease
MVSPQHVPRPARDRELRKKLMLVMWAWPLGAVWLYSVMGAAATEYALDMGVGAFGFGLLAAAPFVGALVQLPASLFIERHGHRKAVFMWSGIAGRGVWLLLAAIPWVGLPPSAWPWALVGGTMLAMLITSAGGPAWMNWAADLIPSRIRSRYLAQRIQLGSFVGAAVALAMGFLLDWAGEHTDPLMLRRTVSMIYVFAAVMGMADLFMHAPVHVDDPPPKKGLSLWQLIRAPLTDREFRWFLAFNALLVFGIGFMGQFANLYLLEVVCKDLPDKFIVMNVMMVVIPVLMFVLVIKPWGRLMDRIGRRPVMVIALLILSTGGVAWIFVTPEDWYLGYLVVLIAVMAWPAIEVGNFNILLSLSRSRDGAGAGSAYIAVNSLVVAIAGVLSGLYGGTVASLLGEGWSWQIPVIDWPVTYHGVLFALSSVARIGAVGCLVLLHEPGAWRTRDAARYMVANIYSNVQQAVFLPARMVGTGGRLRRWSNALNPRQRNGGR